ncbi:MAG: transporter substrate-binding domain-containing protein [Actinomycetota bacterium]|nr:transporter substrate-binding domain-containing protein [Actinomycetota bacterium]
MVVLLVGCGLPRDPAGTLARVEASSLRVGVVSNPPWADFSDGEPTGIEVELVNQLASELGTDVQWRPGPEADLFAALEVRAVDLLVGGLTADDPFVASSAATRPYTTTRLVVGLPQDTPPREDLAGLRVAVEPGTEAAGTLVELGAVPVLTDDVTRIPGNAQAVAVDDWLLDDLRLRDSDVVLHESAHVFAAPLGENGWLVTVERFLFSRAAQISAAVRQAGPS